MIYNDNIALVSGFIKIANFFIFLVNDSDQFEGNFVLEINWEVSQEEYTFFDDSDVRF